MRASATKSRRSWPNNIALTTKSVGVPDPLAGLGDGELHAGADIEYHRLLRATSRPVLANSIRASQPQARTQSPIGDRWTLPVCSECGEALLPGDVVLEDAPAFKGQLLPAHWQALRAEENP